MSPSVEARLIACVSAKHTASGDDVVDAPYTNPILQDPEVRVICLLACSSEL